MAEALKGLFIAARAGEEGRSRTAAVFADWLRGFGNLLISTTATRSSLTAITSAFQAGG
jgi:septal ring factor EnvC (AmiA/AmiB activator)